MRNQSHRPKPSGHLHPIEQLLAQRAHSHKESTWVLSYLDVFILLSMMFIVLLSLSHFTLNATEQKVSEQEELVRQLKDEIEPLRQLESEGRASLQLEHWQERVHQVLDSLKLSDDVALSLDDEYVSIQIEDRLLFDSGNAEMKAEGQRILTQLMPLFNLAAGTILVEGHTDNQPIDTARFPSNWELGAARASSVVKFLASQGMPQARLRAISYADSKPVDSNDTAQGRQRNRRVAMLLRMPDQQE